MTTKLSDRMDAANTAPEGRDATIDELLEVYDEEAVAQMADLGLLTPAQRDAWDERVAAGAATFPPPAL